MLRRIYEPNAEEHTEAKEDVMGGTYSTHEKYEQCVNILGEKLKEGDHIGDICVDGRIILKLNLKTGWEGVDWIHLAQ